MCCLISLFDSGLKLDVQLAISFILIYFNKFVLMMKQNIVTVFTVWFYDTLFYPWSMYMHILNTSVCFQYDILFWVLYYRLPVLMWKIIKLVRTKLCWYIETTEVFLKKNPAVCSGKRDCV